MRCARSRTRDSRKWTQAAPSGIELPAEYDRQSDKPWTPAKANLTTDLAGVPHRASWFRPPGVGRRQRVGRRPGQGAIEPAGGRGVGARGAPGRIRTPTNGMVARIRVRIRYRWSRFLSVRPIEPQAILKANRTPESVNVDSVPGWTKLSAERGTGLAAKRSAATARANRSMFWR